MTNVKLKLSLFVLRISIFVVMLMWVINMLLNPQSTVAFNSLSGLPDSTVYVVGTIELILVGGFLLGIFKTTTYGAVLLIQAISVFSLIDRFFKPFAGTNLLLFASLPMLAACLMLFFLRKKDTFFSLQ